MVLRWLSCVCACGGAVQAGTAEFVEMRVYNPHKQAADHDPNGTFIRRWLPELRNVPNQYVHEPARMPLATQRAVGCVIGRGPTAAYPPPIVAHKEAYDRAKHRLMEAREAMGFQSAAARKRRPAERDCHDIGEMLRRSVAARTGAAEPANQQTTGSDVAAEPGDASGAARGPRSDEVDEEETHGDARARLSALGFPPELISRALSAFPTDVNRAADWILQAEAW